MTTAKLTIDHSAIVENWRTLNTLSESETGAVVKANAYGLDAASIAHSLARVGVFSFFVAIASEGSVIRDSIGPKPEIYVFAGHMRGETEKLTKHRLIPILNSSEQLRLHLSLIPDHPFAIQLDTGMNRLGMEPEEWLSVREKALSRNPVLMMSHLACSDTPSDSTNAMQLKAFKEMTDGLDIPKSFAATGGILMGSEYHFDVTRPGIGLYGGSPFSQAKPVVRLDVSVIQTRELKVGEAVGYGNAWVASRPTRIATIAAGYADGIVRTIGSKGFVFYDNIACPIVGRVSMDLTTIDITELDHMPQTLNLIGPHQTIDDLAKAAGTIGYEILTSLGERYDRNKIAP
ncbi:MAG: alanine racemase [Aestuariivita sp.]|nr:alanine racemase [Aestuariivita sp.]